MRDALKTTLETTVAALVREGRLSAAVADVPVEISDTKSPEHGDYACNFAMVAAKRAGMNPRALGEMLAEALRTPPSGEGQGWGEGLFESVEVAGPGFLNLRLNPEAIAAWVPKVLATERFGHLDNPNPQRINVEFVSVNPNGPITIGSGRGAAFGSALSNVLQAAGNTVHREYYINDGVNSEQMRQFGYAVASFYDHLVNGADLPPDLPYRGEYVQETAARVASRATRSTMEIALDWIIRDEVKESKSVSQVVDAVKKILRLRSVVGELESGHDFTLQNIVLDSVTILNDAFEANDKRATEKANVVHALIYSAAQFKGVHLDPVHNRLSLQKQSVLGLRALWGELLQKRQTQILAKQPKFNPFGKFFNSAALNMATDLQKALPNVQVPDEFGPRHIALANWFRPVSEQMMIERQRGDLEAFGVHFDTWFSEQSLHDKGIVAERIEGLKTTGVADEEPYRTKLKLGKGGVVEETIREDQPNEDEGAEDEAPTLEQPTTVQSTTNATLWLRSTKFGDDMDRVLRRRDGRLTYIASDVAYHEDKLSRPENATKLITILGPDHHGYIGRLTAVMAALLRGPEDTPEANALALAQAKERLEVVIYQLVRFLKDGKPAPMRKRDGNIYELRDLIDELGKSLNPEGASEDQRTTGRDVARFFYLMRSHDTTMDFDIDLATQQSDENPVFYAQYAHARICSVLTKAKGNPPSGEGQGWGSGEEADYRLLTHPRELALVKKILDLPWEVGRIAQDYGVHRLGTYAVELARTYHHFYDACRVIQPDEPELTAARLDLCRATKVALHATFELLGVSSPERLERRAETLLPTP